MKIFAYGTLKKGGILHKYMEGAKYVKRKKLVGYALYLSPDEKYPLLYYTGKEKDIVVGEMWKIDKKIKHRLDKHEAGYILKKIMDLPIMTYYPELDILHTCKKIPKDKKGRYNFKVKSGFYKGFYDSKILLAS
ncbi:MAG: gamma-glutamylcyclotransferase family protein [Rickettsiales bacterium]